LHDLTVLYDELLNTEWLLNTAQRSSAAKQWLEQLDQKKKKKNKKKKNKKKKNKKKKKKKKKFETPTCLKQMHWHFHVFQFWGPILDAVFNL